MFKNSKLAFQSTSKGYTGGSGSRRGTSSNAGHVQPTHAPVRGLSGGSRANTPAQVSPYQPSLFVALAGRVGFDFRWDINKCFSQQIPLQDKQMLTVSEDDALYTVHYTPALYIKERTNQGTAEYSLNGNTFYRNGIALGKVTNYAPWVKENRVWNFVATYLGVPPNKDVQYNYLVLSQDLNIREVVGLQELANLGYCTTYISKGTANALNKELVDVVANSLVSGISSVQGLFVDTNKAKLLYRIYQEENGIRLDKGVVKHASYTLTRSHDYSGYLFRVQLRGHRTVTLKVRQDIRGRLSVVLPDELYTPTGRIKQAYTLETRIADQLVKILGK